ncbi:hypothetical protein DFH27DRAFT_43088 [Peziza echinospora]|nr:hypothetical protein DFH27DRAFT_43088 [Peziza echinospora]
MVEYKAILKLVPSVKPRRTERYPGNYPSTDDAEALISEEADRNSQIQKDTRELVFTPSTKIYLIGRASGNPTRGLVARRNNGFFLSPVMSRYHAEVQMLESKKAIRIKDTNSMHGTFVNNLSIWSGEWKELSSGDTITFGTQVARDGEVFTPKDFKCDIQWEALPPVKPDPPKDMSTKTSRLSSGYGVLSEDLIISDDDTESVDYDKGVGEYPLFSEEEYSENSEEEEEAEEIDDDEEDENDGMDEDEDITFDREDSAISTEIVSVSTAHTVVKNSQTQQKSSTDGPKPTEERNKVEPEHQTTSTTATTPTSRKKFSITSLMNETREQNRNSLADGEEGESTSEKATSSKGKEKEASSPVVKYPGEKPGAFGKWQSPKIREEPASNSYPKNTVSLLDGAELLIQNATNKPKIAPWNNPSHVNESSNRTTADLDAVKVGSPPLPPASYLPLPTIAKLDHLARERKRSESPNMVEKPISKFKHISHICCRSPFCATITMGQGILFIRHCREASIGEGSR